MIPPPPLQPRASHRAVEPLARIEPAFDSPVAKGRESLKGGATAHISKGPWSKTTEGQEEKNIFCTHTDHLAKKRRSGRTLSESDPQPAAQRSRALSLSGTDADATTAEDRAFYRQKALPWCRESHHF